jgi:hypothetical protein
VKKSKVGVLDSNFHFSFLFHFSHCFHHFSDQTAEIIIDHHFAQAHASIHSNALNKFSNDFHLDSHSLFNLF